MASQLSSSGQPASYEDKLRQVGRLVSILRDDLDNRNLSASQRLATLEELKVLGRDPKQCDPIFTEEGIQILGKHGLMANDSDRSSAREGLKCLANALLVVPRTRQIFVDLGFAEVAAAKFASNLVDDEFLLARILFLITYDTTADLKSLLTEHHLEQNIDNAISRYVAHFDKCRLTSSMEDMALAETLKLVFNLSHFVTDKDDLFLSSAANFFQILCIRDLPPFPLQPPITLVINALLNLNLSNCKEIVFPASDPLCNTKRLAEILDKATDSRFVKNGLDSAESFDDTGTPLITLLRKIIEIGPEPAKTYLKSQLLPSEAERNQPLGKGTSFSARLLQASTCPTTPNTRENLSYLLFELSSSNAEEFIYNIGYGYASGFLVTHNIPIPASTLSGESSGSSKQINPITGQKLESEPIHDDPFKGMTDEEKEREAERLFVLFERLKKTGIVNVKNPVQQAVEEGRFEELE